MYFEKVDHIVRTLEIEQVLFLLTRENKYDYLSGRLDEQFIRKHIQDFSGHFYVCGPDLMVNDLVSILGKAGAETDTLVFEK